MFSVTDTSKPVTRAELLEEYATNDALGRHIKEVERLVSSLSAITKAWPDEEPSQSGSENTKDPQNHLVHELKQRINSQVSFGQSFDSGLIQLRLSTILSSCDRLRAAVEHLESRVVGKLKTVENLESRLLEKLKAYRRGNRK